MIPLENTEIKKKALCTKGYSPKQSIVSREGYNPETSIQARNAGLPQTDQTPQTPPKNVKKDISNK
ncbi:MAG: hypothetical protein ABIJ21_05880 [Nanoarchaeota archaeon]